MGRGWRPPTEPAGQRKTGTFALHTLKDSETIAKLATGLQRFTLPDEFNWIKIFERVAGRGKDNFGQQARDGLAGEFEDRRQYVKAAAAWFSAPTSPQNGKQMSDDVWFCRNAQEQGYPIKVDTRIIASTNRDLEREVEAGRFREDLFYRLNVVHLAVPPLRERRGDIPVLVDHLVHRLNAKLGTHCLGVERAALWSLIGRPWKGNVRELENVLWRVALSGERALDQPAAPPDGSLSVSITVPENSALVAARLAFDRAFLSLVLSVVIVIMGLVALLGLPVATYTLPSGNTTARGVAYWPGEGPIPPRIMFTSGPGLVAVNAITGEAAAGFKVDEMWLKIEEELDLILPPGVIGK